MCIHYDSHDPLPDDEEYWQAIVDEVVKRYEGSYVVRPTNQAPAVWHDPETDQRRMSLFEFGMMPSWGKADEKQKIQYRFFNARDDKLLDSKLWEPRFKNRRCIIPANGFYEPHKYPKEIEIPGAKKPTDSIPFYFRLKSSDVFGFAGIWDEWTNKETGEVTRSFSIITTGANQLIKKIHNKKPRTPMILHREDYDFWLSDVDRPQDLYDAGLFEPWPDDDMEAWQVSKELDYGGNGEQQIQPVEDPVDIDAGSAGQGSLF